MVHFDFFKYAIRHVNHISISFIHGNNKNGEGRNLWMHVISICMNHYLMYRHLLIVILVQTTMSCSIPCVCGIPIAIQHTVLVLSRCTLTVDLMVYNFVLAIYHEYLNQNVMDKLHFHCQVEIYISHCFWSLHLSDVFCYLMCLLNIL